MAAMEKLCSGGRIPGLPKDSLCGWGRVFCLALCFQAPPKRYLPCGGEPELLLSESHGISDVPRDSSLHFPQCGSVMV